jgi:phosphatidylserine synthase
LTPSAAVSAAPALNVTATAEDYTGKPAPAGAVVMTMAALLFNPPVPAGMGTKIVIYIDTRIRTGTTANVSVGRLGRISATSTAF